MNYRHKFSNFIFYWDFVAVNTNKKEILQLSNFIFDISERKYWRPLPTKLIIIRITISIAISGRISVRLSFRLWPQIGLL